jgi:hypothetical protein
MRGDMSHVQMRPTGVPVNPGEYYDPLRAVRDHVRQRVPYFAYFAESFLVPPGYMAYGDEVDHLEACHADSTLGDLQSMVVGSERFRTSFADYWTILKTRSVAPNFTLMTGDKDDPRFDEFYLHGNLTRLFLGLFLMDMPSYMGLGFEQRDRHLEPAPNEHYTKLYVFQIDTGPKATKGPYQWGQNLALFQQIDDLRQLAERLWPVLEGRDTYWLHGPETTAEQPVLVWTQMDQPHYLFAANLSAEVTIDLPLEWLGKDLQIAGEAAYAYGEVHYEQLDQNHMKISLGPEGLLIVALH